jgi:NAD(P)-dependent dehydrogenase (short-subunit alcohol dehydrogenase family)
VDIADPDSIRALYAHVGRVNGVVCCAGEARPGALTKLSDEDFAQSLRSKLMGQVNLVRFGVAHMADNGVFLLTAGIYGTRPPPRVPAMAMVNGGLESFARAAAKDLPRGIRLCTISSPFLKETATRLGMQGAISAADNAQVYVRLVEGSETGQVIYPS